MAKSKKRMRLPNGIGSVHLINDGKRRRKPWRARVPSHVEFNAETGKVSQKYINLGYYETETEAIEALFDYRKNPYTLDAAVSTFADVYDMWAAKKFAKAKKKSIEGYKASYNHSAPLHNKKMRDIKATDLDKIMQSISGGYQVQLKLRVLWKQLFAYALEHDIITKDYSANIQLRDPLPKSTRDAITDDDIIKIWDAARQGDETAAITMVYIFTGMRATELFEIPKSNVFIDKRIMIGGKKTAAGIDRRIPIHRAILPIIEEWMQYEGETLLTHESYGKKRVPYGYSNFRTTYWNPLMSALNMDYTLHEARHTLATLLRRANVEEDIRKLILGHKSNNVTDIYTHIPDNMLIEAIDKIPIEGIVY